MPTMLLAASRQALGDRKTATELLEAGLKVASKERKDQFLYKLAELAALDGRIDQSRTLFERILKEGSDPDWQRLARQSLEESKSIPSFPPASKKK